MIKNINGDRKRSYFRFVFGFAVLVAMFFVVVAFFGRSFGMPTPDAIAIFNLLSGNKIVENETGGYYFVMPGDWYLENNGGAGLTVYPNYDPRKASSSPKCKIEISNLPAHDEKDLSTWLTRYLHEDPTSDVLEISRAPLQVYGYQALEWHGIWNNVTTTLAYFSSGKNIIEIAPSTLGEGIEANCEGIFKSFIPNIYLGTYEP